MIILLAAFVMGSKSSSKAEAASAAIPGQIQELLRLVPKEYDLMIKIDLQQILKESAAPAAADFFRAATGKKYYNKMKELYFFISRSHQKDGLLNLICVTARGFDPDQIKELVKQYENIKVGEYSGKTAFRYCNLAAVCCSERLIVGTTDGLKKTVDVVNKKSGALSDDYAFVKACENFFGGRVHKKQPVYCIIPAGIIANAAGTTEVAYRESLSETLAAYFSFGEREARITLKQPTKQSAEKLAAAFADQAAISAKETKEELEYVNAIEPKETDPKAKKRAVAREAFSRKLLKLVWEFNQKAKASAASDEVTISVKFEENIARSINELITTHANSWWTLAENFISSEISCERYRGKIENAALLYLSEHPEADKKNIFPETLCDEGYMGFYPQCPAGGAYSIMADDKGRIAARCSAHVK